MNGRLRRNSAEQDSGAEKLAKISDFRRTYAEQELKAAIQPPNIAEARRTGNSVNKSPGFFTAIGAGIAAVATGTAVVLTIGAAAVGGFFAGAIGDLATGGATGGSLAILGAVAATGVAIANRDKISNFVSNRLGLYPTKHVDKVCGHVAGKVQQILKEKYLERAKELDSHGVSGQAHTGAMNRYMSALKDAGQQYMQAYYEQNIQGAKKSTLRYLQAPNDLDFKADLKDFIADAENSQNKGEGIGAYNKRTVSAVDAGSPLAHHNPQYGLAQKWAPASVKQSYAQMIREQQEIQRQQGLDGGMSQG